MKTLYAAQYDILDIEMTGRQTCANPFYADLYGVFTGPGGMSLKIPGFYDGDNVWKVRFSPPLPGEWTARLESKGIEIADADYRILCEPNTDPDVHGALKVDPDDPHHFVYEDGTDCFLMAYECDWLWALGLGDPEIRKIRELVEIIKRYGFNQVIVNTYAYDTPWAPGKSCPEDYGPPSECLWEGTNDNPDHSRMNIYFFKNFDRMMDCLLKAGISVHLFLKVYNKQVKWPERYSAEEDLYFRYITARYQAFSNVIWDFSKEAYHESDKSYIADRIRLVKGLDAYGRLFTLHDDKLFYSKPEYADLLDFVTLQQHSDLYAYGLLEWSRHKCPVFNSEFQYEVGPGGKDSYLTWTGHTAEETIHKTYNVVMSGCYPAYYYDYTAWDIIDYSYTPKGYEYLKILYDFFTSIPWKRFRPDTVFPCNSGIPCMSDGEGSYIVYTGKQALVNLKVTDSKLRVEWINTRTGERISGDESMGRPYTTEGISMFKNPFGDIDSILYITRL